jgi:hypothetical protein
MHTPLIRNPKLWVGIMFFVVLAATLFAYIDAIPSVIKVVPHYDSIGHFVLFGLLGYTGSRALGSARFPLGYGIVGIYAICDEMIQMFSHNRTFDLGDLAFSLLGILSFTFFEKYISRHK